MSVVIEAPKPQEPSRRVRRGASWIVILPVAFTVYAATFAGVRALEERNDLLGDGDIASFIRLVENFSFTRVYGDPYNVVDRSVDDIAQKHKVHHLPYVAVAGTIHRVVSPVYQLLGMPQPFARHFANALIVCINLLLLRALLLRHNPSANPILPFLVLYAFSLSTWVFASVPESWPFSATLVLGFFLVLQSGRIGAYGMAALVGLIMVNNLMLGSLVLFIALRRAHAGTGITWRVPLDVVRFSAVAVAAWALFLMPLSLLDPMLRPDHVLHYTLWFKDFTALGLPPWDPYVWKSAISNLFFTGVISNQPDPAVPQEAVLLTIQSSILGSISLALWAALLLLALARGVQRLRRQHADGAQWRLLAAAPEQWPAILCLMVAAITGLLYYSSGFLYSTIMLPLLVAGLCRELDLRRRPHAALFAVAVAAVLINNATQVHAFRTALDTLVR